MEIVIKPQQQRKLCPVQLLSEYLHIWRPASGPLFQLSDGSEILRDYFIKQITSAFKFIGLDPKCYKSHNFRIGGALFYAEIGFSDSQIRLMGRWRSDAFKRYIRSQRLVNPTLSH